jgi:hypothetical protein
VKEAAVNKLEEENAEWQALNPFTNAPHCTTSANNEDTYMYSQSTTAGLLLLLYTYRRNAWTDGCQILCKKKHARDIAGWLLIYVHRCHSC